jgi:hypothetical protein
VQAHVDAEPVRGLQLLDGDDPVERDKGEQSCGGQKLRSHL